MLASIVSEHVYRRWINIGNKKKSPTSEIFLLPHCGRWNAKTRLLCILSSLIEFRLAFRAVRSIYWRRMDKINLFSRFFPICPPSCVGTHAYARCGSQLDCTRKRVQERKREREGEKSMWRWLVAKVNCWSPGRHPLCRIFFVLTAYSAILQ